MKVTHKDYRQDSVKLYDDESKILQQLYRVMHKPKKNVFLYSNGDDIGLP
jgi:hypothetical protein